MVDGMGMHIAVRQGKGVLLLPHQQLMHPQRALGSSAANPASLSCQRMRAPAQPQPEPAPCWNTLVETLAS